MSAKPAAVPTAEGRISRVVLEGIITAALEGMDLEHDSEWSRPPECQCHARGLSCLSQQASPGSFKCLGRIAEVDTPEEHVVTPDILTGVLPAPDYDGMVGITEAGSAVIRVLEERLLPHPYTLRAHAIIRRLAEEAGKYEGVTAVPDPVPASLPGHPLCMYCGAPIPAARGPLAKFCRASHRVALAKRKRAERERVAAPSG